MAEIARDAIRDTTTSTGTGPFTVSGVPPTGFKTFSDAMTANDTIDVTIRHRTADEWVTGSAHYSASNELTMDTVKDGSSGAGVAVSFSSGTKDIFSGPIASRRGLFSQLPEVIKTADYNVVPYDAGTLIVANKATAITFNLPTLASAGSGAYRVRNIGVGDLTVDPSSTEQIEGGNTLVLKTGDWALLEPNGSLWRANLMRHPNLAGSLAGGISNLSLVASAAGNALTIAIKTLAGGDPSASDPIFALFRDPTLATGSPVLRSLVAATSLVISSGSTMGFANATAGRLWIVLFDDGGTLRLGAVNCRSGVNIMALTNDQLLSSTAEGGAGAADSAQVIYTGTAVTTKALRILGYMDWGSGLTTAGTWAIVPTKIQLMGPGVPLPGTETGNLATSIDGAVTTGTTTTPDDDTIPQNTEGTQFMAAPAITPAAAPNILDIEHLGNYAIGITHDIIVALHQDSVASALAAGTISVATNYFNQITLRHRMLAATVAATTFKIRAGGGAASTVTLNGSGGGRALGGVYNSVLMVKEIMG